MKQQNEGQGELFPELPLEEKDRSRRWRRRARLKPDAHLAIQVNTGNGFQHFVENGLQEIVAGPFASRDEAEEWIKTKSNPPVEWETVTAYQLAREEVLHKYTRKGKKIPESVRRQLKDIRLGLAETLKRPQRPAGGQFMPDIPKT
jgi:hypothetical protein